MRASESPRLTMSSAAPIRNECPLAPAHRLVARLEQDLIAQAGHVTAADLEQRVENVTGQWVGLRLVTTAAPKPRCKPPGVNCPDDNYRWNCPA